MDHRPGRHAEDILHVAGHDLGRGREARDKRHRQFVEQDPGGIHLILWLKMLPGSGSGAISVIRPVNIMSGYAFTLTLAPSFQVPGGPPPTGGNPRR